jgi:hypothetical protein
MFPRPSSHSSEFECLLRICFNQIQFPVIIVRTCFGHHYVALTMQPGRPSYPNVGSWQVGGWYPPTSCRGDRAGQDLPRLLETCAYRWRFEGDVARSSRMPPFHGSQPHHGSAISAPHYIYRAFVCAFAGMVPTAHCRPLGLNDGYGIRLGPTAAEKPALLKYSVHNHIDHSAPTHLGTSRMRLEPHSYLPIIYTPQSSPCYLARDPQPFPTHFQVLPDTAAPANAALHFPGSMMVKTGRLRKATGQPRP